MSELTPMVVDFTIIVTNPAKKRGQPPLSRKRKLVGSIPLPAIDGIYITLPELTQGLIKAVLENSEIEAGDRIQADFTVISEAGRVKVEKGADKRRRMR